MAPTIMAAFAEIPPTEDVYKEASCCLRTIRLALLTPPDVVQVFCI